jgi:hypothetical protein
MNEDEKLQQNINRTTSMHALKQIHAILEQENKNETDNARALRWLLRYGWIIILLFFTILAHLAGVF